MIALVDSWPVALGVGSKAVPALTSPMDLDEDEYGSLREAVYTGVRDPSMSKVGILGRNGRRNVRSSIHFKQSYSSSALHGIMEQGAHTPTFCSSAQSCTGGDGDAHLAGLVEISTKPTEGPLTRTIGDPSTGTEAQHLNTDDLPPLPERPAPRAANSSYSARGLHLTHLPKPHPFSLDGSFVSSGPSLAAGNSPTSLVAPLNGLGTSVQGDMKLNVLVVDDDPLTRKLMSRMLTRLNCQVTTAENGEIALELILHGAHQGQTPSSEDTGSGGLSLDGVGVPASTSNLGLLGECEYRYGVVFLDNQMPVMSGLEAVSKLRALNRKDFVVGVTGNALLSDQQEYLEAGVDQYVF